MSALRTLIYLTADQRNRIEELMRRENVSLAAIVREALDVYLASRTPDYQRALDSTFGVLPDLIVPTREEWERE